MKNKKTNQKNKEYVANKQILTLEQLIKNKTHVDFFTASFKNLIEKQFVIDSIIRVSIVVPFMIVPVLIHAANPLSDFSVLGCTLLFLFSLVLASQGNLVFNDKIFHGRNITPFFKTIISHYFMTYRAIQPFAIKYKKLSKEQRLLLNSLEIPKTGCDIFSYNLCKKLTNSKPSVVFKNKDILIELTKTQITEQYTKLQLTNIMESKLFAYEQEQNPIIVSVDENCDKKLDSLKERFSDN